MHSHIPEKNDHVLEDARVTAYVFGQLTGDELKAFEELLENDPRYQAAVEETKRVAMLLESSAATELAGTYPLSDAKVQLLEEAISHQLNHRRGGWMGLAISLASAAALVGVLVWSGRQPELRNQVRTVAEANRDRANEVEKAKALIDETSSPYSADDDNSGAGNNARELAAAESVAVQQVNPEAHGPTPEIYESAQENEAIKPSPSNGPFAPSNGQIVTSEQPATKQLYDSRQLAPPSSSGQAGAGSVMTGGISNSAGYGGAPASNVTPYYATPNNSGMGGMGMGNSERMGGYGSMGSGGMGGGMGMGAGGMGGQHDIFQGFGNSSESLRKDLGENRLGYGGGYGDTYEKITDNAFMNVSDHPLSTFSIDVDTASYSKVRMMLQQYNRLPPADAVRIEEMLNYFSYQYQGPEGDDAPFAANMELATCPWNEQHKLARIAIKGKEIANQERAVSNLVFLLDVSGSMNEPNKLPLVRRGLEMMLGRLGENDRIAIVVYAGAAGLVLESTTADKKDVIFEALDRLQAGGSTNGGQGIQLAYQTARDHFVKGGTNRVILCTDGDFNVGTTGTEQLVQMVEQEAKSGIFLTVLGFGTGNLNDAMLEAISGRGDGNYAFIDTSTESHKVLVEQLSGTLVTIAKDVKIQLEFNPLLVDSYRLIGYENRVLAAEDFADDTKDAGEIGAGHTVTALYEIVPAGATKPNAEELKYQSKRVEPTNVEVAEEYKDELLTLKLRYKAPEGGESKLLEFPIKDSKTLITDASSDFRFAASVAGFGMLLRDSPHRGKATFEQVRKLARGSLGEDPMGLRAEFLGLIDIAAQLTGK